MKIIKVQLLASLMLSLALAATALAEGFQDAGDAATVTATTGAGGGFRDDGSAAAAGGGFQDDGSAAAAAAEGFQEAGDAATVTATTGAGGGFQDDGSAAAAALGGGSPADGEATTISGGFDEHGRGQSGQSVDDIARAGADAGASVGASVGSFLGGAVGGAVGGAAVGVGSGGTDVNETAAAGASKGASIGEAVGSFVGGVTAGAAAGAAAGGAATASRLLGHHVITVAAALNMPEESTVVLRGSIVRRLGGNRYEFRDSTASVALDIDDDKWDGRTVTPHDTIVVLGEIDRDRSGLEVEVDFLMLDN